MVTGSSSIPRTHEPSQGAGQRRPVKSGKLFVAERAALVAERDAAVHAAARLLDEEVGGQGEVDLPPVANADVDAPALGTAAPMGEEPAGVSHVPPP
jgi:hypothetical protein